jgi:hypothetical protein
MPGVRGEPFADDMRLRHLRGVRRHLRPDDLANRVAGSRTPAPGEEVHEEQTATRLVIGGGWPQVGGGPVRAGVRDFDTDEACPRLAGEAEVEFASGHTSMAYGVGGEFRDQTSRATVLEVSDAGG